MECRGRICDGPPFPLLAACPCALSRHVVGRTPKHWSGGGRCLWDGRLTIRVLAPGGRAQSIDHPQVLLRLVLPRELVAHPFTPDAPHLGATIRIAEQRDQLAGH